MPRYFNAGRAALIVGPLVLFSFLAGCSTVPVTGRSQLDLIPASTMLSMSNQQYSEFLGSNPLSRGQEQTDLVRNVGGRIQGAVEQYFRTQGMSDQLAGYGWQFNPIESREANAWCMPGGKVVVYSGLLPVTQTETGLAVVVGHEIAHAVAEHGRERMSQQLVTQLGGMALSEALSKKPQETRQLWMTAFGIGTQYGALLPLQPHPGERGRSVGPHLHGHGRLRSA
jgi:predicted Zn-dependent protease